MKHGYNENRRERDKVYEEMPDAIMRILFHSRPNVQLCANKGIKAAIKPQKDATPKAKGVPCTTEMATKDSFPGWCSIIYTLSFTTSPFHRRDTHKSQ